MRDAIRYNQPVIAPAFIGASSAANPFGVTFYVSNTTNPTENQGSAGPTRQGRSPKNPFATLGAAISEAVSGRGDRIVLQRGTYSVSDLAVNKAGLVIEAANPYGYPDHVLIQGDVYVTASGVTLRGMEFFSGSASEGSVAVGMTSAGAFSEVNGFTAERCSFASDGTSEPEYGLRIFGGNNHTLIGCRFVDNTRGLSLRSGSDSFVSGVRILFCEFLENTAYDIGTGSPTENPDGSLDVTGDGLGRDGGVRNLVCKWNTFGAGEVTPTDFINIVGTSSGVMAENTFASATNASATITIPAGILYGPNGTEAGWSSARPA